MRQQERTCSISLPVYVLKHVYWLSQIPPVSDLCTLWYHVNVDSVTKGASKLASVNCYSYDVHDVTYGFSV